MVNKGTLSFDARFLKYQFSLHYHKQCSINKIQVKCLQISQNVSDIFWTLFWQIERIADFIILVQWPQQIAQTNGNWLIYIDALKVEWSCDFYRHAIWRILKLGSSGSNFYLNIVFLLLSKTAIPSLRSSFSQKHVLETQMNWNQK